MSHEPDYAEQLSALMDGELPEAEARFLLRRLEHDAALRATWERMQLASQCLRAHPWQPMDAGFADRVSAGLGNAGPRAPRAPLRWAIAASVLALGLVVAPRLLQQPAEPASSIADAPAPAAEHIVPSPASADLVALRRPAARASAPTAAAADIERTDAAPLVAAVERSERASPVPLGSANSDSPADFPLVDHGEERSWPRSELVSASSDPAIEAYLVRHNQMMANDGLGGFVPYVDVVSNSQPGAGSDAAAPQESDGK